MKLNVSMLCLAGCLAITATADAQQGGGRGRGGMGGFGRGGIFMIVGNEAVQKDLGLSSSEVAKVKEITDDFNAANREGMSGIQFGPNMSQEDRDKMASVGKANAEKFTPKLKAVLTADQFTRLQQINWQNMGTGALADAEVVKALSLTKDQQDKVKTLTDEYGVKTRELFSGGGGGGGFNPENMTKMREINKERDAKITEVLTKDQQDKFASLKGKEFDVDQLRGGRGGRGGGGGGGGGGQGKRPQPKAE